MLGHYAGARTDTRPGVRRGEGANIDLSEACHNDTSTGSHITINNQWLALAPTHNPSHNPRPEQEIMSPLTPHVSRQLKWNMLSAVTYTSLLVACWDAAILIVWACVLCRVVNNYWVWFSRPRVLAGHRQGGSGFRPTPRAVNTWTHGTRPDERWSIWS